MPVIILIRPQLGRNIGAAIRAMVNCGMTRLRLVQPRDGWPSTDADDLSAGAVKHLDELLVFDTLEEAVADCQFLVATTARRRDMSKEVWTAATAAEKLISLTKEGTRCAYLFGPERTGLTNKDVALCNAILTIPLNPSFSSLNLAQGVLLVSYEYDQARRLGKNRTTCGRSLTDNSAQPEELGRRVLGRYDPRDTSEVQPLHLRKDDIYASHGTIHEFLDRLIGEIDAGHFFRNADVRPHMERNITNYFIRSRPTDQEIRTLHGIISALIGNKKSR